MRLVMTLLVRDEEDILEANLDFHLNQGVDLVIATDNDSSDTTPGILDRYEREGHVHVLRQTGDLEQSKWVTRMARLAATDFGADWVINNDADEFWWPMFPSLTLADIFSVLPPEVGALAAPRTGFVARPETEPFFADRMTLRNYRSPAHPRGFQGHPKRAHRGRPDIVVGRSNNRLEGEGLEAVPGWHPIVVFHYQARTLEGFARKKLHHGAALERMGLHGSSQVERYRAHRDGVRSVADFYLEERLVDDEAAAAGLEDGRYTVDERLRRHFEAAAGDGAGAVREADREVERADLLDGLMLAIDEWQSSRKAAERLERRAEKAERRLAKQTERRATGLPGMVRDAGRLARERAAGALGRGRG